MKIRTMADAAVFVKKVQICTVFPSDKTAHTSLYEHVDLPEKQPGEKGWGRRVEAVWQWKNQLPARHPDEIYYGKIKGGFAALMDLGYLAEVHFPSAYRPVETLNELARRMNQKIHMEPWTTTALRKEMIEETGCSKSRFDTALKNLQVTLNVVRDSDAEQDTWLAFREVHAQIWNRHVSDA